MRILILIIGLFATSSLFGQIAFFNIYSNNGDESGEGIVQLEDSSYMVTGSSSSFAPSLGSQAFLLHIDSMGNFMSSTHYGGPESEVGRRVLYQPNDGYYIAGYTNSYGNGGYDYYLVKTDLNGVEQWSQTYGGAGWERVWDAAIMPDSGVMMIGETSSNPTDNLDMYIVRTDKFGDTLWTKTIGGAGDDVLKGMASLNDSTYYVVGYTYVEDSLETNAVVMRIDDEGQIQLFDTLDLTGSTYLNALSYREGVKYMAVGYSNGNSPNGDDSYYVQFDTNGVILYEYSGPDDGDQVAQVVTDFGVPDVWYIGIDYENQWSEPNGNDCFVGRYLDNFVYAQSAVTLHYENPDYMGQLIETSDGGAVMVGRTYAASGMIASSSNLYVVKIGPNHLHPDIHNIVEQGVVNVSELSVSDDFHVYPNPANADLFVKSTSVTDGDVTLVDAFGRIVITEDLFLGELRIDLSSFKDGVYYLRLSSENTNSTRKIVIQH